MNTHIVLKLITAGLLIAVSRTLIAATDWPHTVFKSDNSLEVIRTLSHSASTVQSEEIHIKVPEIAENGAVVPITVSTTLSDVATISILVDNNPTPLTSTFMLAPDAMARVSTRVKMANTSDVIALVTTRQGQHYTASKNIKVTIGGCGG